jgi:DNA-binding cell septation regulator SpoVG
MRLKCGIETCSMPNETRKAHEDFEALMHNVCWECGEKIKDKVGNKLTDFLDVIHYIEKELR